MRNSTSVKTKLRKSSSMESTFSKFHLGEIKVCENPPQCHRRFRNSTSVKSKLANSTSVKSTLSRFYLGEIKICEFHLGEIKICEITPSVKSKFAKACLCYDPTPAQPRFSTAAAKVHFRRSKPRIFLVAAGFKPAWRAHQVQRPEPRESAERTRGTKPRLLQTMKPRSTTRSTHHRSESFKLPMTHVNTLNQYRRRSNALLLKRR